MKIQDVITISCISLVLCAEFCLSEEAFGKGSEKATNSKSSDEIARKPPKPLPTFSDYKETIEKAKARINKNPKDASAYIDLGYAYGSLGYFKQDLEYCNKAIQLDPNIPVAYSERATAYQGLKKYDLALKDVAKAIQLDPKNSAFYASYGWIYREQKKYSKAIEACSKSIEIYDGFSPAFYCRGIAYLSLDQYKKAIKDFTQAIKLYPKQVEGYYVHRAMAYIAIKRYDEAIADLNNAIAMEPKCHQAKLQKAVALFCKTNYEESIPYLDAAIRLKPDSKDAYGIRGKSYLKLEKFEKAKRDFSKVLELDPTDYIGYEFRGKAKIKEGDLDGALKDLELAVELNPKSAACYQKIAEVYKKLKKPEEERKYKQKAFSAMLKRNPFVASKDYEHSMIIVGSNIDSLVTTNVSDQQILDELENNVDFSKPFNNKTQNFYWLIDQDGNKITKLDYKDINEYSEGLAAVTNFKNKIGFIDPNGKLVIPHKYSSVGSFSEGLVWCNSGDTKCDYIDKTGKIVINNPLINSGQDFSEGLAAISIESKGASSDDKLWGFIDKSGKFVIEPKYQKAQKFKEDRAAVKLNDRWFFIDKSGKKVTSEFDFTYGNYSQGMAPIAYGIKWGYVGLTDEERIPVTFDFAKPFSEELAAVKIDGLFGFINKEGKLVIQPNYTATASFSDGLCPVKLKSGEWSYIDKNGKSQISDSFEMATSFVSGIALVVKDRKAGIIKPDGQFIIEPKFKMLMPVQGNKYVSIENNWNHPIMRMALMGMHLNGLKLAKDPKSKTSFYIPKNLNDALKQLDEILPKAAKKDITEISEPEMNNYHMGFGTGLRNSWGLWKGSRLAKYFNSIGIHHPDDMTGIIFTCYWRKVHKQPLKLKVQVSNFKKYWGKKD